MSGQHYVSIDARGRALVPQEYRTVLAKKADDPVIVVLGSMNHIEVCTPEYWAAEKERLLKSAKTKKKRKWLTRIKLSTATEKTFDQVGRIRIEDSLARKVGLKDKDEALVIGMDDHVEIWEPGVFDRISEEEAPYVLNEYDDEEEEDE